MEFEWDEAKAAVNVAKHGVQFEIALEFDWANAVTLPDERFDYGERRSLAIGRDVAGEFYAIVLTLRGGVVRIISARKANRKEIARWQAARET